MGTPQGNIGLAIVVGLLCFMCGASLFVAVRAISSNAEWRDAWEERGRNELRSNNSRIVRFGRIEQRDENHIRITTVSSGASQGGEKFLFEIAPATQFIRRDAIIERGIIIGFAPDDSGSLQDLHPGMMIYVAMERSGTALIARRIIYGEPFPLP